MDFDLEDEIRRNQKERADNYGKFLTDLEEKYIKKHSSWRGGDATSDAMKANRGVGRKLQEAPAARKN